MKLKLYPQTTDQRAGTVSAPLVYHDDPDAVERLCDDLETLNRLWEIYGSHPQ